MEVRFTAEHEWVAVDGNQATVGITDYAQRALGDLVFVQLPAVGTSMPRGAVAAVVESVKAASDIFAPLTGRIVAVNPAAVANLNQQFDVSFQERAIHGHRAAVWKHESRVIPKHLGETEDVIPSAAI